MGICFFIDFENVHNSGLSNLKGLSKDDLIFIFYTASTETITLDNINQLNKSGIMTMSLVFGKANAGYQLNGRQP